MEWLRRLVTDTDDEGRFRAGLGIVFGASVLVLPLLLGALDAQTTLVASLCGLIAVLPFWRLVAGPSEQPGAIGVMVVMFLFIIVIARELPALGVPVFLGAATMTLNVVRLRIGWRFPAPTRAELELPPAEAERMALVGLGIPLLVVVGMVVWALVTDGGA